MQKPEDQQVRQSEFGLSSLLMGLCSYEDAKRSNVIEGLDIIVSGPLPSNPAELLGSYRMEQMIKDLSTGGELSSDNDYSGGFAERFSK